MTYRVLFQSDADPYHSIVPMLEERCQLDWWREPDVDPAIDLGAIEGVYVYSHMWMDRSLMERMPNLKVISNFGVGCDHIDLEGAAQLGIPVGNTPGVLDATTADLTFALLMAAARNLFPGYHHARGPDFTHYDAAILLGQHLTGGTLGIIGLGRIGYQVAKRALGFDMEVVYHNRNRNMKAEEDLGARYVSLDELLSTADFVALNMPLTDETRGMIGRRELALMKPTAVLVNAASGPVIDQEALVETMRARRIHCAALDVTDPEPLPRDHELLRMDNVIVIPHLGSATVKTRDDMTQMSVENLFAGLDGREVPHRIA